MSELAVLIPARHEEWLSHTVADVFAHARADTEVIVVLDGAWPTTPLVQQPKLTVLYQPESVGQRAAVNYAARVTHAPYVLKLDAHCAVADGFDVALLEAARDLGPDVTQIPAQKNLHVYDWVCDTCGRREYQCGLSACRVCGGAIHKDVVWQPRRGVHTTAWRFDPEPRFQYWRDAQKRQQGDYPEVMTSLGACFFMARERFWQLGGLDERHGSWGSFGIEIACKSWLSGGRQVVNTRTWFAHFFRVGGQGFPYPISGQQQEAARQYARALWFENRWPGQVRPLRWLVDHFWPVPGWTEADRAALPAQLPHEVAA